MVASRHKFVISNLQMFSARFPDLLLSAVYSPPSTPHVVIEPRKRNPGHVGIQIYTFVLRKVILYMYQYWKLLQQTIAIKNINRYARCRCVTYVLKDYVRYAPERPLSQTKWPHMHQVLTIQLTVWPTICGPTYRLGRQSNHKETLSLSSFVYQMNIQTFSLFSGKRFFNIEFWDKANRFDTFSL